MEYVTIHFPNGDQHLIPRHLIKESRLLERMLAESHDNNLIIHEIASEIFDELVHYLNNPHSVQEDAPLHDIIEAAEHLELNDASEKLKKLAQKRFNSAPHREE